MRDDKARLPVAVARARCAAARQGTSRPHAVRPRRVAPRPRQHAFTIPVMLSGTMPLSAGAALAREFLALKTELKKASRLLRRLLSVGGDWKRFKSLRTLILTRNKAAINSFVRRGPNGTSYFPDYFTPRDRFDEWAELVWLYHSVFDVKDEYNAGRFTWERILRPRWARQRAKVKYDQASRQRARDLYGGYQFAVRRAWRTYLKHRESEEISAALNRTRTKLQRARNPIAAKARWAVVANNFKESRRCPAAETAALLVGQHYPNTGIASALLSGKL